MDIIFSVAFAAMRNNLYRSFYNSLKQNSDVPFEVVFVGPNPPTEKMPDNFRYIETNVKPAQCIEIAARESRGEYLLPFSDDMTFSPNLLDRLYNYTQILDMDKNLISFRYSLGGENHDDFLFFDVNDANSPLVGLSPVFRKDIWHKLGGLDNRFVGSMPDVDMQMRFFEYGFNPFLTPDCMIDEIKPVNMNTLYRRSGRSGIQLVHSLWKNKNGTFKERLSPVQSFVDKDILTVTQGERTGYGKKGKFIWN